ncbi:hypothetical protein GQ457_04G020600 [Hibiscus cannabinus]
MTWYRRLRLAGCCFAASSSGLDGLPWSTILPAVGLPLFLVRESGVGRSMAAAVVGVGAEDKIGTAGAGVEVDGPSASRRFGGRLGRSGRVKVSWNTLTCDPASSDWAGAGGDGDGPLGVLSPVCSAGAAGVVAGLVVVVWLETGITAGSAGDSGAESSALASASGTGLAGGVGNAMFSGAASATLIFLM